MLFFHTVTPWSSADRMYFCGGDYDPHQRADLGVPCAMVLYMHEGDGYRAYALSGGP